MATGAEVLTRTHVLTLTPEEATVLRELLMQVSISDKSFTDDDAGELEYDRHSDMLERICAALSEARAKAADIPLTFALD